MFKLFLKMTHCSYKRLDCFQSYMAVVVTCNHLTLLMTFSNRKLKPAERLRILCMSQRISNPILQIQKNGNNPPILQHTSTIRDFDCPGE